MTGRLCFAIAVLLYAAPRVASVAGYGPRIPADYLPKVVLHVDYGETPDKVRTWLGVDEVRYEDTGMEGLRMAEDRFYFIDNTSATVKCYMSPGIFLWQTQKLENLHYLAVAPDCTAYVVWGNRVDKLSRIDRNGKLVWTVGYGDVLSPQQENGLGFEESLRHFGWLEWTSLGLTSMLLGTGGDNQPLSVAVLIDREGRSARGLPGFLVGEDGTVYGYAPVPVKKHADREVLHMVGKGANGRDCREVELNFGGRVVLSGKHKPGPLGKHTTPDGGFAVEQSAVLSKRYPLTKDIQSGLEHVLWVFEGSGNLKQEWRVLASHFGRRYHELSVGPDGNVYHLRYTDTGIDVVKYSRSQK